MDTLRLYIVGKSVREKWELEDIRSFLKKNTDADYGIEIIDVLGDDAVHA